MTLIIAEAGVNHNGDLKLAFELVEAAARAGPDVVKFQTFKAKDLVTAYANKAAYQIRTTGVAESQISMLKKLELNLLLKDMVDTMIALLQQDQQQPGLVWVLVVDMHLIMDF